MGSQVSSAAAVLFTSLLALLIGFSSILGEELRERDALCHSEGCFVVYFQRKTFLDSWRACKENGGNLATIKRKKDATSITNLFLNMDLPHSHSNVRVWIGLQRQPRQCSATRPLRGFSWTTGDQDTDYTNWQKEDSPSMCSVPRCVVMGYSTQDQTDNFKWLDGSCSVPVDGYLCYYPYNGMCPALQSEGAGNALYTTPFNLISTLLTHIPIESVAILPCPQGTKQEQTVVCTLREDGSAGWSRETPLCSNHLVSFNWCDQNGGCEHFCRPANGHFYCECAGGYQLGDDGKSCEPYDVCQGAPCESECVPLPDGYRCACPDGYMLAQDERGCLDVDECTQSPCEQLCENAEGTFECRCWEGYEQDDKGGCKDIDECMNDPCEHECENTEGSHICLCSLGFSPVPEDPSRCQDTDECQIQGTCEQMCANYDGGFQCDCEEGYELLSDRSSCRKTGEGDGHFAVTPPYPWATPQPGYEWDPTDYGWGTTKEDQFPNWQPGWDSESGLHVIWVTRAPETGQPFDSTVSPDTHGTEEATDVAEDESLSTTTYTTTYTTTTSTPSPTSNTFSDEYEGDGEEVSTPFPFLSTSVISEGAWNWWDSPSPESDETVDHISTVFTQSTASPSPLTEGAGRDDTMVPAEPVDKDLGQGRTWLLLGLLLPMCIFIVVMVALGIIYCSHCAVRSRNTNAPDCYHWISGAQDKQGAPNPSVGVKTHV
ncbi:CD248 molecule, endosialin a [Mugil cephalus]|uniref:CD248 molecule, endosialin a n=1 Tax=Mugil cephalus TaxID=48193 RepID=UPI001FB651B0|nr:CD248 molecule, endosialin a [Mugil cephalus]